MRNVDLKRCITDAAVELSCGNDDIKGRLLVAVRALRIVLIRSHDVTFVLPVTENLTPSLPTGADTEARQRNR